MNKIPKDIQTKIISTFYFDKELLEYTCVSKEFQKIFLPILQKRLKVYKNWKTILENLVNFIPFFVLIKYEKYLPYYEIKGKIFTKFCMIKEKYENYYTIYIKKIFIDNNVFSIEKIAILYKNLLKDMIENNLQEITIKLVLHSERNYNTNNFQDTEYKFFLLNIRIHKNILYIQKI